MPADQSSSSGSSNTNHPTTNNITSTAQTHSTPQDTQRLLPHDTTAEIRPRDEPSEEQPLNHPESVGLHLGGRDSFLRRFRNAIGIQNFSGSSSMIWFCPAYVIDWGVGLAAIIVSKVCSLLVLYCLVCSDVAILTFLFHVISTVIH
jgi:hypothetical protein